jgi:hypothetical protein
MSAATSVDGRIRWDDEQYGKIHDYIVDRVSASGHWATSNIYTNARLIGVLSGCDLIRAAERAVISEECRRPLLRGNFNAQQIWDMAQGASCRLARARMCVRPAAPAQPAQLVEVPTAALNTLKLTREEALKMIPHVMPGTLIEIV